MPFYWILSFIDNAHHKKIRILVEKITIKRLNSKSERISVDTINRLANTF